MQYGPRVLDFALMLAYINPLSDRTYKNRRLSVDDFEWALYSRKSCDFSDLWLEMQGKVRSFPKKQLLTKSNAEWLRYRAPK